MGNLLLVMENGMLFTDIIKCPEYPRLIAGTVFTTNLVIFMSTENILEIKRNILKYIANGTNNRQAFAKVTVN